MPVDIRDQAAAKGMSFREFCSMAGKKAKGKPKKYRISKSRICSKKCPLWNHCFLKYVSLNPDSVDETSRPLNGKCALAHQSRRVKELIRRLASMSHQAFGDMALEVFAEVYLKTAEEGTFEEKMRLLRLMIKMKNILY